MLLRDSVVKQARLKLAAVVAVVVAVTARVPLLVAAALRGGPGGAALLALAVVVLPVALRIEALPPPAARTCVVGVVV